MLTLAEPKLPDNVKSLLFYMQKRRKKQSVEIGLFKKANKLLG
jgi:hypothetical protein